MSYTSNTSDQDRLQRMVNSFATQSFRDQADRDYIAARLACRHELIPQFLWASQQAIEKYLKAILLYNRIKATGVRHNLGVALNLMNQLPFPIDLSDRTRKFIDHLSSVGEYRYIDVPYHVNGYILIDLDVATWELRRYCQVLNVFGKKLPPTEQTLLDKVHSTLAESGNEPRQKFRLHDGLLENIIADPTHPSRSALLWQNASYGLRLRTKVRVKSHLHAQNSLLYLYPEMLEEIQKYVFIPKNLADEYRKHHARIKANPNERP